MTFEPEHELARIRGRGRALPAVFMASLLLWALLIDMLELLYGTIFPN